MYICRLLGAGASEEQEGRWRRLSVGRNDSRDDALRCVSVSWLAARRGRSTTMTGCSAIPTSGGAARPPRAPPREGIHPPRLRRRRRGARAARSRRRRLRRTAMRRRPRSRWSAFNVSRTQRRCCSTSTYARSTTMSCGGGATTTTTPAPGERVIWTEGRRAAGNHAELVAGFRGRKRRNERPMMPKTNAHARPVVRATRSK